MFAQVGLVAVRADKKILNHRRVQPAGRRLLGLQPSAAPQTAVSNTFTLTNFGGLQMSVPNNGLKAIDFSEVSCTGSFQNAGPLGDISNAALTAGSEVHGRPRWGERPQLTRVVPLVVQSCFWQAVLQ